MVLVLQVNHALAKLRSKGLPLTGVRASQIVDGNLKITLGLIWAIIHNFEV